MRQHTGKIVGQVEALPDITFTEVCERLVDRDQSLVHGTVWTIFHHDGYKRQKTTENAWEQERDDVQEMRADWTREQASSSGRLGGENVICIRTANLSVTDRRQ